MRQFVPFSGGCKHKLFTIIHKLCTAGSFVTEKRALSGKLSPASLQQRLAGKNSKDDTIVPDPTVNAD